MVRFRMSSLFSNINILCCSVLDKIYLNPFSNDNSSAEIKSAANDICLLLEALETVSHCVETDLEYELNQTDKPHCSTILDGVNVCISSIDRIRGKLHVFLVSDLPQIARFWKKIQEFGEANNTEILFEEQQLGTYYACACYKRQWYRALCHGGANSAILIDVGKAIRIQDLVLRKIEASYLRHPQWCHEIRLKNVSDDDLTSILSDRYLVSLLLPRKQVYKVIKADISTDTTNTVELYNVTTGKCVNAEILNCLNELSDAWSICSFSSLEPEKYAEDNYVSTDLSDSVISDVHETDLDRVDKDSISDAITYETFSFEITAGSMFDVVVVKTDSYYGPYFVMPLKIKNHIEYLMAKCVSEIQQLSAPIKDGDVICFRDPDSRYHRGRIFKAATCSRIYLLDSGITLSCYKNEIYSCPQQLRDIPDSLFPIKFHAISDNEKSRSTLGNFVKEPFTIKILSVDNNGVCQVDAYKQGVSLASLILEDVIHWVNVDVPEASGTDFASFVNAPFSMTNKKSFSSLSSETSSDRAINNKASTVETSVKDANVLYSELDTRCSMRSDISDYTTEISSDYTTCSQQRSQNESRKHRHKSWLFGHIATVPLKSADLVLITYAKSFQRFFVAEITNFRRIKSAIEKCCSMLEFEKPYRAQPSEIVLVLKQNGEWERAKVMKWVSKEKCQVHLIDTGENDVVNAHNIRKISAELYDYPHLTYKCSISADAVSGIAVNAATFPSFVRNKVFKIHVLSCSDDGIYTLDKMDLYDDISDPISKSSDVYVEKIIDIVKERIAELDQRIIKYKKLYKQLKTRLEDEFLLLEKFRNFI